MFELQKVKDVCNYIGEGVLKNMYLKYEFFIVFFFKNYNNSMILNKEGEKIIGKFKTFYK